MANISKIKLPNGETYNIYDATAIHTNDVTALMNLKGTKSSYEDLPVSGNKVGDVWLIYNTGEEYVYDDTVGWVKLGYNIDAAPSVHKHSLSDITDYVVDDVLSSTSTNPVQNKVVNEALLSTREYTDAKVSSLIFVGTYKEYEAAYAKGEILINTFVVITDDETSGDSGEGGGEDSGEDATTAKLGYAVLGKMILG